MGNCRIFRQHWLVKLVLPGLPWLSLFILISTAVFYLLGYSHHAIWLFIPIMLPLSKLLGLCLDWLSYSVTAVADSNVLTIRSGILNVRERRIPLTEFTTITYKRPCWAILLGVNMGDAIIVTVGGRYLLACIGDFSDLREVLESRGHIVPPKQPPALAVLLRLILRNLPVVVSSLVSLMRSALAWFSDWVASLLNGLRQALVRHGPLTDFGFTANLPPRPLNVKVRRSELTARRYSGFDGDHIYRGTPFSPLIPSYAGFCAFCQQFIIEDKNWTKGHYCTRDPSRRYYPDGIAKHVAQSYLDRLRAGYVLIPEPNGCEGERLSRRIKTIEDIRRLIPDFSSSLDKVA